MSDPDPRAALARLAAARGDSMAALSAMLGRNAAYLQQYVKRGSPRRLAEDDRRLLAQYLGVEDHVLGGSGTKGSERRTGFRIARLAVQASAGPGALVDDEVLLGTDVIDPALARRLGLRDGRRRSSGSGEHRWSPACRMAITSSSIWRPRCRARADAFTSSGSMA
ncbi:hypothetical protein [Sphingomonas sp. Ant20]|uniref:hypothetical protein n=1 Tax=Sphingomonas sp. Ant20 TaxID=104605 RepID=UPI000A578910|nr:hypothetical protein [Sphingomonas sp. Ant20]